MDVSPLLTPAPAPSTSSSTASLIQGTARSGQAPRPDRHLSTSSLPLIFLSFLFSSSSHSSTNLSSIKPTSFQRYNHSII
ncbi:hypothetical protein CGCF415_v010929 [Colletotrichum fructicola]|nr:hypothetical protein CGCFRS4_v009226 [Colletotrichum fructicola]KAF4898074.1 hypothetical protein CGCF415_v010929 [Colletotrichum fructicola]KAF4931383.1 hypothetical protein CGCF245_v011166 [Colletotrichum fructicola]KAF5484062.1 hypothetical protein CGCF413_v014885 [Colletotrichum fructicola]